MSLVFLTHTVIKLNIYRGNVNTLMSKSLESRLKAIEERNARVEKDKAWETSLFRRFLITGLTYVVVVSYLLIIDADRPLLSAVVPSVGYFLSTLVIKSVKDWWVNT